MAHSLALFGEAVMDFDFKKAMGYKRGDVIWAVLASGPRLAVVLEKGLHGEHKVLIGTEVRRVDWREVHSSWEYANKFFIHGGAS